MKMNSTMMSSVTSWMRRMADDVLLRSVLPNLCSAIPGTLVVKGQFCNIDASCHLLGFWELVLLFSTCRFGNCSFASLYPLRYRWCLSVFVNTAQIKYVHISFSLLLRGIVVDTEMYNVIQVSNPSIRPVADKLRLPVNRNILPSTPD